MNRIWIVSAVLFLGACSTVLDKSAQEVRFETPGARDSMCRVDTGKVSYKVFPPEDIIIMKTDNQLEVECFADGNRQRTLMVEPILSSNTFLNFGTGFVPGFAVDEHTNAHYIYPDVIAVDFTNIPYKKAAQPPYSENYAAPPIQDIDPKRGGVPAIHDSDLNPPVPLEPRASRSYYSDTPDGSLYQPSNSAPDK